MDIKRELMDRAVQLMQDPRVSKALQNPRVMQGLVGAVQLGSKLQQRMDDNLRRLRRSLHLATDAEVEELRQAIARLERELEAQRTGRPQQ